MATILPQLPYGTSTEYTLNSSSVDHKPFLSGPTQRVSRLGDKWSIKIECRKMYARQAGPIIAALIAGLADQIVMTVPQPGIDVSGRSTGTVAQAVAAGRQITVQGGGTKEVGQLFSIERNGRHHLHQITSVAGNTVTFQPALKTPLSGGEAVDFKTPKLQGYVSGSSQNWTTGLAENVGLSFQIDEAF